MSKNARRLIFIPLPLLPLFQDEDERCYSDSFLDMPALPATETAPEETSEGTESTTSRPVKKWVGPYMFIKI